MNKLIIEKLKEGRINAKLKQSDVAMKIGIKGNTLSNYENGVSEPDIDTFCALCGIYGIDPSAILNEAFGLGVQGESFKIKPSEIEREKKIRFIVEHSPNGAKMVDAIVDREYAIAEQLKMQSERIAALEKRAGGKRILAYYGRIAAAGQSYGFDDLAAGTITCENNDMSQNADFAIGVSGDSMEPTYYDGDIVFVKKASHLDIGDIGIFQKDNGIYIKEVGEDGLISHNKRYDPMINGGTVICLGKVLGKVDDHESMT